MAMERSLLDDHFQLSPPYQPSAPSARKAINSVIRVLENLGNNFAVAASVANVTRDLVAKADSLVDRFRTGLAETPSFFDNIDGSRAYDSLDLDTSHVNSPGGLSQLEVELSVTAENTLPSFIGFAFTVFF